MAFHLCVYVNDRCELIECSDDMLFKDLVSNYDNSSIARFKIDLGPDKKE